MTLADSHPDSPDVSTDADTPCRKCGYNLRGLAGDGRCPECGTPVWISRKGDLLRYSDPAFVHALRRGIQLILWSLLIAFLLPIAGMILGAGRRPTPLYELLELAANVMGIFGAWLLTTPDPSGLGEYRYGTARKIIRVVAIIGGSRWILDYFVKTTPAANPTLLVSLQCLGFGIAFIALIGQFAELNYLSHLAMRIPDAWLAGHARLLMWRYTVSTGVLLVFVAVMALGRPWEVSPVMVIGFVAMGIAGLATLIFFVFYVGLLRGLGRAFKAQADLAATMWGQAHPAVESP